MRSPRSPPLLPSMFSLSLEAKLIGGALAALALLLALWGIAHHFETLGAAKFKAESAEKALAATQENLRESTRREVVVQQEATHADQAASAARADADAAHSAGERLRLRLAAAERSRAASNPGSAASGVSADSPALVPFGVFEGVRSAGEQLAGYADQLRVSLDACIGSYRALTP